jgi:hypothetical protein
LSKATASGVGSNFKDGKYRLAIKKISLEEGFKGTRFQVVFIVMNAMKIQVQSKKTNEILDIVPNQVGSSVDWIQVKLTEKDSVGPGNIKRFMMDLFGVKEISDEEYLETLSEMCDLDHNTGDALKEPLELAKGRVIDMETVRIETQKNKVEIVVPKWGHVPQTEEEQARVATWIDAVSSAQAAAGAATQAVATA